MRILKTWDCQEQPLTYPVLYGNIHSLNIGTFLD